MDGFFINDLPNVSSIHPSIHPSIRPSVHLPTHQSIDSSIYSSIHRSIRPSTHPLTHQSTYSFIQSIHPSSHLSFLPSIRSISSIHPSIHPPIIFDVLPTHPSYLTLPPRHSPFRPHLLPSTLLPCHRPRVPLPSIGGGRRRRRRRQLLGRLRWTAFKLSEQNLRLALHQLLTTPASIDQRPLPGRSLSPPPSVYSPLTHHPLSSSHPTLLWGVNIFCIVILRRQTP